MQYEDCCVLLAARGDFPAYAEALTARGIPVYADARENLLDAPHIRPLIALLRVIDNPAQDIYLAAAMLGPISSVSGPGRRHPISTPASASTAQFYRPSRAGRRMTSPAGCRRSTSV